MPRRLTLDAPLECTIRAAGALDARWSERLGGLRVRATGRGYPVAELHGRSSAPIVPPPGPRRIPRRGGARV